MTWFLAILAMFTPERSSSPNVARCLYASQTRWHVGKYEVLEDSVSDANRAVHIDFVDGSLHRTQFRRSIEGFMLDSVSSISFEAAQRLLISLKKSDGPMRREIIVDSKDGERWTKVLDFDLADSVQFPIEFVDLRGA